MYCRCTAREHPQSSMLHFRGSRPSYNSTSMSYLFYRSMTFFVIIACLPLLPVSTLFHFAPFLEIDFRPLVDSSDFHPSLIFSRWITTSNFLSVLFSPPVISYNPPVPHLAAVSFLLFYFIPKSIHSLPCYLPIPPFTLKLFIDWLAHFLPEYVCMSFMPLLHWNCSGISGIDLSFFLFCPLLQPLLI